METISKQDLLRKIPSHDELMASEIAAAWCKHYPQRFVSNCISDAVQALREDVLDSVSEDLDFDNVSAKVVLVRARDLIVERTQPHLRAGINATGVVLHPQLGRSMMSGYVVESLADDLGGYMTVNIDRNSGAASNPDRRVEYIISELTGAEAATVVSTPAMAMLVTMAALGEGKDALVSRGQLVEIAGQARLSDLVHRAGCNLVEVGSIEETTLDDFARSVNDQMGLLVRCEPRNCRMLGAKYEPPLSEIANLAHQHWLVVVDYMALGALLDMSELGISDQHTASQRISAGADLVILPGDELIGACGVGIIAGKSQLIEKIRNHPLAKAAQAGKAALVSLERTLHLFRDPGSITSTHPMYEILAYTPEELEKRAEELKLAIETRVPDSKMEVCSAAGYLTSDALPMESLPTFTVQITPSDIEAEELACRLRMDEASVFARCEDGKVLFDVRTLNDDEIALIGDAVRRSLK